MSGITSLHRVLLEPSTRHCCLHPESSHPSSICGWGSWASAHIYHLRRCISISTFRGANNHTKVGAFLLKSSHTRIIPIVTSTTAKLEKGKHPPEPEPNPGGTWAAL